MLAQPALAAVPVDLSASTNLSLNNIYVDGGSYPLAGTSVSVNGVSFLLSSYGGGPDTGTIQTNFGLPLSINVPLTSLFGVSRIYTLANTAGYGTNGVANFTFNFASGATYTYDLTSGVNIRDHHSGSGEGVPSDAFGTLTYGNVRFDAQKIDLPSSFASDTLESVTINDLNGSGQAHPFLAALSVEQAGVPEPATWALMITGFGLVGSVARRRGTRVANAAA